MIGVSFAIIASILVLSFMYLRSGRRAGALFALPLISVSVFHLLGFSIYRLLARNALPVIAVQVALDVVGLLVGVVICFILSRAIPVKKLRATYFACCAVFLTALAAAYINYLV